MKSMGSNNSAEFIKGILHERVKYRDVDANFLALFEACIEFDLSLKVIRESPIKTGAIIRAVIERLAREGKLGVRTEFTEAFRAFWAAHPELLPTMAGEGILEGYCDAEGNISADVLEYILGQPGVREQLPVNSQYQEEQARASRETTEAEYLRGLMLSWYETGTKFQYRGAHPGLWPKALAKEKSRLANMDLTQLRQEVEARREKMRLKNLSKEELRAEVRKPAMQNQQKLYSERFPQLPPEIYLRGSFQKVVLNSENLLRIQNSDPEWMEQLKMKYGREAIAKRIDEGRI